jgi:DNA-binding MarR family transcriptional regulator
MDTPRREPHNHEVKVLRQLLAIVFEAVRPPTYGRITSVQLDILNRLDRVAPMRPSALAAARSVSRSAVSHAIRRLVKAGLVERRRDPRDRRRVELRLTEAGEKIKRWPTLVDEQLVREVIRRIALFERYGVTRFLARAAEAAAGRDRWLEARDTGRSPPLEAAIQDVIPWQLTRAWPSSTT